MSRSRRGYWRRRGRASSRSRRAPRADPRIERTGRDRRGAGTLPNARRRGGVPVRCPLPGPASLHRADAAVQSVQRDAAPSPETGIELCHVRLRPAGAVEADGEGGTRGRSGEPFRGRRRAPPVACARAPGTASPRCPGPLRRTPNEASDRCGSRRCIRSPPSRPGSAPRARAR